MTALLSRKLINRKNIFSAVISINVFTAVVFLLYHQTKDVTLSSILETIQTIPAWRILCCLLLTTLSFSCLALYDTLAVKGRQQKIPVWMSLFTGATSNAIANTLGFHAVTGGAWRYRVYATKGTKLADIVRVMSVTTAGIALSFFSVICLALLFDREGTLFFNFIGLAGLLLLGGVLFWIKNKPRHISFRNWSLAFPDLMTTLLLVTIGIVEMTTSIGALYTLLPAQTVPAFSHFIVFYISAIILGIISGAPGGIGVFEATIMTVTGPQNRIAILSGLLLYRLIYNLLPFIIACLGIIIFEASQKMISLKAGRA